MPLSAAAPLLSTHGARSWLPDWWWPSRDRSEELSDIIVSPILPNGTHGSPASLCLPQHQIELEGLRLESWDSGHAFNNRPWYSYNSSDSLPLVPVSMAWMSDEREMERRAGVSEVDLDVARTVSQLVAISYCNVSNIGSWNCTRCRPGFVPKRAIFDPLWDLLGFVGWSEDLNAVVVAFRGTDSRSYYNWAENMRTWRTDLAISYPGMPSHALVHGGFFYSYNNSYLGANVSSAVSELVSEYISTAPGAKGGGAGGEWLSRNHAMNPRKVLRNSRYYARNRSVEDLHDKDLTMAPTVYLAGHSLGGALATMAALDLRINLKLPDVRVISFGSPRVGNAVFAKWFDRHVGPHWRFTHNRDIVPSLPPVYMGFRHGAREIWVVDLLLEGHTLVGVCDGSGEDPKCHASMCHLGLCSSLADHLLYLSEMYTPRPMGC